METPNLYVKINGYISTVLFSHLLKHYTNNAYSLIEEMRKHWEAKGK